MILHQFYLNCLAHASYLVGDERSRIAAVVDPQRDIDQYLAFASAHDLRDRARAADALSRRLHRGSSRAAGSRRRHDLSGRRGQGGIRVHAARRRRSHRVRRASGCRRSRRRDTRRSRSRSWSSICDRSETDPYAVLTGDTLFVGDVGRPDLRVRARLVGGRPRRHAVRLAARRSCCRCRTRASCTRRTAPARSAARRSARKRCRPSASSGA